MYSQMSKRYIPLFFSPLAHTHTVQDSLHLHASNASHIFLELELLLVTSQRKVFNYVQLIRSDGTPPTQAPPSNSGCPLPFPPSWCSLSVQIQEAQDQSPRYEVAVTFPVQKKTKKKNMFSPLSYCESNILGWMERLLVAGSP